MTTASEKPITMNVILSAEEAQALAAIQKVYGCNSRREALTLALVQAARTAEIQDGGASQDAWLFSIVEELSHVEIEFIRELRRIGQAANMIRLSRTRKRTPKEARENVR